MTTVDGSAMATIGHTLLNVVSSIDAIVSRLGVTLSPVSFLSDMPDSRPQSAGAVAVTAAMQQHSEMSGTDPICVADPAAVRATSSLVIDGILATGVRNAEVAATMEELRAISARLQSAASDALRASEQMQLVLHHPEPQRAQRLLSILGDAPNSTSGTSLAGGPDPRLASAMSSMSHIQPLGAAMGGSRTPHRGEAFRDVGDTDVQQWLNENYSHQAKREANGFELTLSRRVESFTVSGCADDRECDEDEDDISEADVTVEHVGEDGQPVETASVPNGTAAGDASSTGGEPLKPTSFLITATSGWDSGALEGDANVPPGSSGPVAASATLEPNQERGPSVAAATSSAPPTTVAPGSTRKLSTNVISPSAAAAALKRQGSAAMEASVRMTYTRSEKRTFPATTSARRLVEVLDVWAIPVIESINTTEFDVFAAHETHGTNLLLYVAANVFLQYNFVRSLQLDVKRMLTFFETVRYFYRDENPYHNSIHAADVLQTTHVYLCVNDVKENFSDVELLALLFAALVHDVGHLGIANAFLCKIRHPFARIFNDASPLENTHASVAFSLLERPECNFFESSRTFTRPLYEDFRTLVIEGLIGTDMRHHHDQTKSVEGILADGQIEDNEVAKLLKAILHAADLSNPMKPFPIYMKWVDRVMAEFWQQGDEERRRGLPISILCDRNSTKVAKSQIGFISFVVKPFVRELAPVLPSVWLERLDLNAKALETVDPEEEQLRVRNITELASHPWCDVDPSTHASALLVIRNEISTMGSDEKVLQPAEFSNALDQEGNQSVSAAAGAGESDGADDPGGAQRRDDVVVAADQCVTQAPSTVGAESEFSRVRGSASSEESITTTSCGRERRSIVKLVDDAGPLTDGDGSSTSPLMGSHPHRMANRFGSRANLSHRTPSSSSLSHHAPASVGAGDAELQLLVIGMVQELTTGYHTTLQLLAKNRPSTSAASLAKGDFGVWAISPPTLAALTSWVTTLVTVERKRNDMRLQEQIRRRRGERRRRLSNGNNVGNPLSLFCAVMQHDAEETDSDLCSLLGPDTRSLLLSVYQSNLPSSDSGSSAASRVATYSEMLQAPDCISRLSAHLPCNATLLRTILSTISEHRAPNAEIAVMGSVGSEATASGLDPLPVSRTASTVSNRKRLLSLHSEPIGLPQRSSSSSSSSGARAAPVGASTGSESTPAKANDKPWVVAPQPTGDDVPLTLTLLAATMTASLLAAVEPTVLETASSSAENTSDATTIVPSQGDQLQLRPVRQGAASRASPTLPAAALFAAPSPATGASTPPATTVSGKDAVGRRSTSHLASYTIGAPGGDGPSPLFSRVVRLPLLDRSTESDPGGQPIGDGGNTSATWHGRVGDISAYRAKHRTLEAIPAPAWMREFLPSIRMAHSREAAQE